MLTAGNYNYAHALSGIEREHIHHRLLAIMCRQTIDNTVEQIIHIIGAFDIYNKISEWRGSRLGDRDTTGLRLNELIAVLTPVATASLLLMKFLTAFAVIA